MSINERIVWMAENISDFMAENSEINSNYACFIEDGIMKSAHTAMILGEARGAIKYAVRYLCSSFENVGNSAWKNYLRVTVGEKYSADEKRQAYDNLSQIFSGYELPLTYLGKKATYDETDALGILVYALCFKVYEEF